MSLFTSFANDRILMDFNTPNLLLLDIHNASYCGTSTKQCVLLEISIWTFHALTCRSCLPQETARVWASGSRGSHTSGSPTQRSDMMMIFVIYFFFFHCTCSIWSFSPSASPVLLTELLRPCRWRRGHKCWALGCWPKAASRTRSSLSGYLHRTDPRYEERQRLFSLGSI